MFLNTLLGGDKSHRLGDLLQLSQVLAQEVKEREDKDAIIHDIDTGPKTRVSDYSL